MKIKELIKLLEKQNPDANIYVACEGYCNAFDKDSQTLLTKINEENYVLKDDCYTTISIELECKVVE